MTEFDKADVNGDGDLSREEFELYLEAKREEYEDDNAKRDQIRKMVWFALFGMLLYPFLAVLTEALGMPNASNVISDMSGVYFMSVGLLVSTFFGADAYMKGKKDGEK